MAGKLERQAYTAHLDLLTRRVGPQLILDSTSLVTEGLTNPADFKFSPKIVIRIPSTLHSPSIIGTNLSDGLNNEARSKLTALKSHDGETWKATVEQFSGLVFSTSNNLVHDWEQARDITQETFLRAWLHIETFQGGPFKNWLFRIAVNQTCDYLRKQRRRPQESFNTIPDTDNFQPDDSIISTERGFQPEEMAMTNDTQTRLHDAIQSLPRLLREITTLYYVNGATYEELVKILGVPIGTIKSRLSRARAVLKDMEDMQRLHEEYR